MGPPFSRDNDNYKNITIFGLLFCPDPSLPMPMSGPASKAGSGADQGLLGTSAMQIIIVILSLQLHWALTALVMGWVSLKSKRDHGETHPKEAVPPELYFEAPP